MIIVGLLMMTGIPFSLYYGSNDIPALLISGSITSIVGVLLHISTRGFNPSDLRNREGYLIVTLNWILMSLFGSLPFLIHGAIPSFTNAFFETVSGLTTTGASILSDIESLPKGLLFWRSMTHWIGGMGIIVLSLAILPILGVGGMQLFKAEVAGPTKDKIHPKVKDTAQRLWAIYVIFTFIETVLLMTGGMNLFDALCHSFGTLASGGFSTKNASVAAYNSPFIEYVIIVFMFIAGTNFTLHYFAFHGKLQEYFKDSEFRFYIIFIFLVVSAISLFLFFNNHQSIESSFRDSAFSVISILSSTGFVTVNYEAWAPFFREVFLILLLFGACAGSTSGGVKMVRYQLLFKSSIVELKRLVHPNAIIPVRHNNKSVDTGILIKIAAFVILYYFTLGIATTILALTGLDLTTAAGSAAACIANIGPGLNQTGPVSNFSNIPELAKWILSAVMILGRLELFSVFVLLSPSFWKS